MGRWEGVLPDRTVTRSQSRYVREWRAFAAPMAKVLGMRLLGFDPGLLYSHDDGRASVHFDTWVIAKINAALSGRTEEKAKKEGR